MNRFLAHHRGTLALGVLVAAWFAGAGCSSGDKTTGAGASSSSAATNAGGAGGTGAGAGGGCDGSASSGPDYTWPACHTCLATKCGAEQKACDAECLAIQACIDAVCANLSATQS